MVPFLMSEGWPGTRDRGTDARRRDETEQQQLENPLEDTQGISDAPRVRQPQMEPHLWHLPPELSRFTSPSLSYPMSCGRDSSRSCVKQACQSPVC